jgi:hypothetical protein
MVSTRVKRRVHVMSIAHAAAASEPVPLAEVAARGALPLAAVGLTREPNPRLSVGMAVAARGPARPAKPFRRAWPSLSADRSQVDKRKVAQCPGRDSNPHVPKDSSF